MQAPRTLTPARAAVAALLLAAAAAHGQPAGARDVNASKRAGNDSECAIASNPVSPRYLFTLCYSSTGGLLAARSADNGASWSYTDPADKTIGDGDDDQGPHAHGDPSVAWDPFGNLFVAYLYHEYAPVEEDGVALLLSTDNGRTFRVLQRFFGVPDQPTVVAARTSAAGVPVAVWLAWQDDEHMVATGARVTGRGAVDSLPDPSALPGMGTCNFGDVAISPRGAVAVVCQTGAISNTGRSSILMSVDPDGLGAQPFGGASVATETNVGAFEAIPAQLKFIDAEAGLAFDSKPGSPHEGRLYMVYTDKVVTRKGDTEVMLRFSDNLGATWQGPIRVNDDSVLSGHSQFLPRIVTSPLGGDITICWHDTRDSASNAAVRVYCATSTATPAVPRFGRNVAVSDVASTSNKKGLEFGDYGGLAFAPAGAHVMWADRSNSTGNNPDKADSFDAYTDRLAGASALGSGDPHIAAVTGERYDFQGAGDFVALRSGDGMEIHLRATPLAVPFTPRPDPYHGLATPVSVITGVAARVGAHRVTFQPNGPTGPAPGAPQLRVDGAPVTPDAAGLDLGDGARVVKTPVGEGVEIDFANGTILLVTPNWWAARATWYLSVSVHQTQAVEGVMGAFPRSSWLPALADGTTLGVMPKTLDARGEELYGRFAASWRVPPERSLFDATGAPVPACDLAAWPRGGADCAAPVGAPVPAIGETQIQTACAGLGTAQRDCVFDLRGTGERGFATAYRRTGMLLDGATLTRVLIDGDTSHVGVSTLLVARVSRIARGAGVPAGSVQFRVDGGLAGGPVPLDADGRATLSRALPSGSHRVTAAFLPGAKTGWLASTSPAVPQVVAP